MPHFVHSSPRRERPGAMSPDAVRPDAVRAVGLRRVVAIAVVAAGITGAAAPPPLAAQRAPRRPPVEAAPAAAAEPRSAADDGARAALPRRIDSLVAAFHIASGAPGVSVAVLRTGTPPILATAGLADLDHAVPVHPATVFQTGSVTKQVTAALVLQLVDTGRVRLADPIGTHLPTLPAAWGGVTVGQLLDRTSGIPSYTDTGARWTRRWAEPLPPDSLVAMTAATP
jgi:CubicO group peptidase (beta-lactamase class C family)